AAGGFDEDLRYAEDDDLFIRLAFQGPFALISATTVDYGESGDSLERAGRHGGGYVGFFERTADRAMAVLERCSRADVEALRRAARARHAIGAAIDALVEGQPVETVGERLDDIRRLAPRVDVEAVVRWGAGLVVPRWYEPDQTARRLQAETLLTQAARSGAETLVRTRTPRRGEGRREAIRQHGPAA